jgi:hypothetical protein
MSSSAAPTKEQLIDLAWRALWTFVQAFLGALTGVAILDVDKGIAVAALAAGFGAVLSLIKTYVSQRLGTASS